MPYSDANDTGLPDYIKNKPAVLRTRWVAIFNTVFKEHGEEMAFMVANTWLKRLATKRGGNLIGRTTSVAFVTMELDNTTEIISRTEDGEEYVTFKLAECAKDKFGLELPEWVLRTWEQAINTGKTILGDIDHATLKRALDKGMPEEDVKVYLKTKPSIAKGVRAVYDDGKLWVKAIIDKRYKKIIQNSKGVSMEALIIRGEDGKIKDGELLGFTFGVREEPALAGTEVHYANA